MERYNRLKIIEFLWLDKNRKKIVKTLCKCWNISIQRYSRIKNWIIKSCWCLHKEVLSKNKWKNHPNWKWWNTSKNWIRRSPEYIKWKNNCFERDNYTCQLSGKKWWKLVVHHLIPFHTFFDDLSWEIILNELIFDTSNWITITEELHKEFHKIYWNINFTKDNFIDFKKCIVGSTGA
jgi:hypothetical protein